MLGSCNAVEMQLRDVFPDAGLQKTLVLPDVGQPLLLMDRCSQSSPANMGSFQMASDLVPCGKASTYMSPRFSDALHRNEYAQLMFVELKPFLLQGDGVVCFVLIAVTPGSVELSSIWSRIFHFSSSR